MCRAIEPIGTGACSQFFRLFQVLLIVFGCSACTTTAPDYLPDVTFQIIEGEQVLLRWQTRAMPLKVYLGDPPDGLFEHRQEIAAATRTGVLDWANSAGPGIPSFVFVDSIQKADIPITWIKRSSSRAFAVTMWQIRSGERRYGVNGVVIAAQHSDGTLATLRELHGAVLHEMGHALGLAGHSSDPDDVMYGSAERTSLVDILRTFIDTDAESPDLRKISERDRATITRLYEEAIGRQIEGTIPALAENRFERGLHGRSCPTAMPNCAIALETGHSAW